MTEDQLRAVMLHLLKIANWQRADPKTRGRGPVPPGQQEVVTHGGDVVYRFPA